MKRLKQRVLPILGGRPAFPFPEGGAEGGLGGKAAVQGDALDGEAGGLKQEAGRTDPGGEQILVRRKACCLGKNAQKVKGAHSGLCGEFLETGVLHEPEADCRPDLFLSDEVWKKKLEGTIEDINRENWYAHYHLGLFAFRDGDIPKAIRQFEASKACRKNAWALHGLAAAYLAWASEAEDGEKAGAGEAEGRKERAAEAMEEGLRMRTEDLSYLKEGFRILSLCGAWTRICRLYPSLPETMQADGRLRFYEVLALDETGSPEQAFELMEADGGLVLDDVREGETNLGGLWQRLQKKLTGKEEPVPYRYDFKAI